MAMRFCFIMRGRSGYATIAGYTNDDRTLPARTTETAMDTATPSVSEPNVGSAPLDVLLINW